MSARRLVSVAAISTLVFALSSCGGGSSAPQKYTVGGSVVNLAGTGGGLELSYGGATPLQIDANGNFTLPGTLSSGSTYTVTVLQQPSNPTQTCGITNGSGTATANVTNITIDCSHNEWTWQGGASMTSASGVYGTKGVAAATNFPGARQSPNVWRDSSGTVWLFGGFGYDSQGTRYWLNDLWMLQNGQWTWVTGSNLADAIGVYGTQGTPAAANTPGAREYAVSWIDPSGALWLFGGNGESASGDGLLNDLWKFSNGEWTWVSGTSTTYQLGSYGTKGVAASSNVPGSRYQAVGWADASGNLWLFGGISYVSTPQVSLYNDLWKFSNGEWTWMAGANVGNQSATWGSIGTPSPANTPAGKAQSTAWSDASGNFWLYGGTGWVNSINGSEGMADLWKYSNGEWTWVNGPQTGYPASVYGTKGTPSSLNTPGYRQFSSGWTDAQGNIWLFGGGGTDSTNQGGNLNDLWEFSNGEWTWISGSNLASQYGIYGTQGVSAPGNIPGNRLTHVTWTDANGNFWLLGGFGSGQSGTQGDLNDVWMYKP